MGVRRIAGSNPTLTNYAAGLAPSFKSALAEFMAPTVKVGASIGQYKKYDDNNSFQVHDTARAVGGPARRLEFFATDPTYNCQPQALEVPIDDSELDAEGNLPMGIGEAKTAALVASTMLSHEDKVITKAKTVAAVAGLGGWGNAANKPVAEIDACIREIATATGQMPNRIVFGLTAWERFRNHDDTVKRQPGAVLIGLTPEQARSMILNTTGVAIEIRVGVLSKLTTKPGATPAKAQLLGDDVFIFLASQVPTQYDPSWLKTFQGGTGGVESVRTYRDDRCRSDILAVDWSEDIQEVSTLCRRRITTTG